MFRRKPKLPDVPALYDKLRASGMNDWVGGADPEQAGQGAFDKDGLAVLPGNAPRFVVQRLNDPDRHGRLRKSANFNNGLH